MLGLLASITAFADWATLVAVAAAVVAISAVVVAISVAVESAAVPEAVAGSASLAPVVE